MGKQSKYRRPTRVQKQIGTKIGEKELVWVTDGDKELEVWRSPGGRYSVIEPVTRLTLLKGIVDREEAISEAQDMEGQYDEEFVARVHIQSPTNLGYSPPQDWKVGDKPSFKNRWRVIAVSPPDPWHGFENEYSHGVRYAVLKHPDPNYPRHELCQIFPITKMTIRSVAKEELASVVEMFDPRIELPPEYHEQYQHVLPVAGFPTTKEMMDRHEGVFVPKDLPPIREFSVREMPSGEIEGLPYDMELTERIEEILPVDERSWEELRKEFVIPTKTEREMELARWRKGLVEMPKWDDEEDIGAPPIRRSYSQMDS